MTSSANIFTSSARPMRRTVIILLLLAIVVVSMWMVGWWGGGGSDDVAIGKHHLNILTLPTDHGDDKRRVIDTAFRAIERDVAKKTTNQVSSNITSQRHPSASGGSLLSCEAKLGIRQRIEYFEDSLNRTIALISSKEEHQTTDPIIKAGSSSGVISPTGKFVIGCAHQAFEDNFQASLLGKKAELQALLKHLKTLLQEQEEGQKDSSKEDVITFPVVTTRNKKGTMLPVFNSTLVSSNQLYTPLITIDELVHGPCHTGDGCINSGPPTSMSAISVQLRRTAIEEVISASSPALYSKINDGTTSFDTQSGYDNRKASSSISRKGIHVYMVHYTPMKQRREAISKLLRGHRIFPEWVTGFDKEDIDTQTSGCITGGETSLKPSQISVVVKHHSALYDAVRYKRPLSLILEDDALLRYDVAGRLGDLLVEVYQHRQKASVADNNDPKSASTHQHYLDVMWVGGCIKMHGYRRKYNTVQISPHLFEKKEARCAHAYLVSYTGAKRLLENFPLSRPIDFQLTDAMKTASIGAHSSNAAPVGVTSLWVEPWLSIQGDMGGCVTNDIGAKCITVVKKYDPAFDGEKLPVMCADTEEASRGNSSTRRAFVDLGWTRVPKHGSS